MQLGNMRWEHTEFNARLQPVKIALGKTPGADDMLDLVYGYGSSTNNGNVMSQTISVDDVGAVHGFLAEQTYTYDELNRLKSATEMNTPNTGSQSQSWKQTYLFDRFGNRRFDTTTGATTTIPGGCSTAVCNPTFNLANNRFASGQGYSYDSAGNVTEDAEGKKFVYDAENKQKSFGTGGDDDNGGTYFYDGDGRRVKKIVGTEVTIFVYSADGQLVAEYATTAAANPQVNYLSADALRTPRINTDANGVILTRHDYMPFGEELTTFGNRSTIPHYAADSVRHKFTLEERDSESELDFYASRYYSNRHGRFSSADSFGGYIALPQSLNLYAYVQNNPLIFIDPNGHDPVWVHDIERDIYFSVSQQDYDSSYAGVTGFEATDSGPDGRVFILNNLTGSYADDPEYQSLVGQEVYLGEDGRFHAATPSEEQNTSGDPTADGEFTSSSISLNLPTPTIIQPSGSVGAIVDSNNNIFPTVSLGASGGFPLSYTRTVGSGSVTPGIYLYGTASSGIAVTGTVNLSTRQVGRETGVGTPTYGGGIQIVLPPLRGSTQYDIDHNPGNPNATGNPQWRSVGRCPY